MNVEAYLELAGGKWARVDPDDLDMLSQYSWWENKNGRTVYALADIGPRKLGMHRLLMGVDGPPVDHINGNGLDNRRSNLRHCTMTDNQANRGIGKNNTSGFKGIHFDSRRSKWSARVGLRGKKYSAGRAFATAEEAARAYDDLARRLFGEFAKLNFPDAYSLQISVSEKKANCHRLAP